MDTGIDAINFEYEQGLLTYKFDVHMLIATYHHYIT